MFDGFPLDFSKLPKLPKRLADTRVMRRLAEQFADLSARHAPAQPFSPAQPFAPKPFTPASSPAQTVPPAGGGFHAIAAFGDNPGALGMQIYMPPNASRPCAALVVVLHGCTQNARTFAVDTGWTAMADRTGAVLVLPEQTQGNNQNLCFNWFRSGDARRDGGEMRSIRSMVAWASEAFRPDSAKTFVLGLSAGGAMALAALAAYPDVFSAGAVVAGLPAGGARNVASAFGLMNGRGLAKPREQWAEAARALGGLTQGKTAPRLSIWQGTGDGTVNSANAGAIAAQWTALRGLPEAPTRSAEPAAGVRRSVWERDGRADVESWTIDSMAHGYPVTAHAAPDRYVLPASVDATLEIARFFGLMPNS